MSLSHLWEPTVLHLHFYEKDTRIVMRLHPFLAPYKAAILPLSKKLGEKAEEVRAMLSKHFMVEYDDAGSIGKRYRRQDEIGTPFCITYDFDSLEDQCVTVRYHAAGTHCN